MFNKKSCIEKEINFKLKSVKLENFCVYVSDSLYTINEEHEIDRIYDAMFRIKPKYYRDAADFFDDYREVLVLIDQYCFHHVLLFNINLI